MSPNNPERDRKAEMWLIDRHDYDWYIGNATTDEWVVAYQAVDEALSHIDRSEGDNG